MGREAEIEFERALARLDELIAWDEEHKGERERNEAATRFDLIDGLLLNVLRWPREQVRPEEHSVDGYADYVMGAPQRQLVLEAKKEGHSFRLPDETPTVAPFSTLFKLDPDLKDVVEQARRYASNFGLPYAAVSNGHQLVAFLATRIDGVEPLKGRALAFPSLPAMRERFADLWDGLSRAGVQSRRLSAMLAGEATAPPPPKVSSWIPGYPGQARTDPLIADLRLLGELFLLDIVEHPDVSEEFLKQCYLDSGALSQHASVTKRILKSRYSEALKQDLQVDIAPARTRKGVPKELLSDVAAASMSARPIILLGYVGVGKTMFIRHLIRVDARSVLTKAIVLYVDLGREPALEQLEPYIADHFIDSLSEEHGIKIFESEFVRRVYEKDLQEFAESPWGELADVRPDEYRVKEIEHLAGLTEDRQTHLRRSLEHLATVHRRQIVTILDNVDQRPAQVQDQVFLLAETLAKSWPGTVFVALRPDTFNRSRRSGTLTAYQPRVFAVDPPRIDRVLEKRIQFAQLLLGSGSDLPQGLDALTNTDSLARFLEIIRLSLRRSKALAELVDNVSGQNARRAIELLTTVVSSPHSKPRHAVERAKTNGHYSIPYHEFLRAIMLGDRERYEPGASRITNLLDISSDDGREHFLLPIIISMLRRTVEPGAHEGFVPAQHVYRYCQDLGFRPEQVTWQLERGIAGELLQPSPIDGAPELYRATAIGSYTEQRLLSDFTYLDEICIDTPIVDDVTRAVIEDTSLTSERVRRTDRFMRYLDTQWEGLSGAERGFDWPAHAVVVRAAVEEIERRLDTGGPHPTREKRVSRARRRPSR